MASAKEHYDNLLAPYYSWICGGADAKLDENRAFFRDHNLCPERSAIAVDLGAGSGFQSIPLAESGFNVIALDMSHELLAELKDRAKSLPIAPKQDNLLNFAEHSPARVEIIVCMGDTLTHLESFEEVQALFKRAYAALEQEGIFILSFRELTAELTELDRFIPVRSDAKKIFTCFLEYEEKHVKVHDILYEKTGDQWNMKTSFFRKLRLSAQWTKKCLLKADFKIEMCDIRNAMATLIARKH